MLPAFNSAWLAPSGIGRQAVILLVLAGIAILALIVASAAFLKDQRQRLRHGDDELFTTTPLPMGKDDLARLSRSPSHHVFTGLKIPRWVQAGSLLGALGITWLVAQRIEPDDRLSRITRGAANAVGGEARDTAEDTPEDLDLVPDSSPAFSFRVRDWVERNGGGCAGRLEVTKGEPNAWNLTARVHDGQGQLLDTARARVSSLQAGDVVEFTFPRADCDRIGAWDVRGAQRR